jgi:hypothetical protein
MKSKNAAIAVLTLAATAICGCLPEKRVAWSPDGRWAAIRGSDGLYLCDPSGKLSERKPFAEGAGSVAWLPDSKGLILSYVGARADTWDALAAGLSGERRQKLEAVGPQLRNEILTYEGDWKDFKPKTLGELTPGEAGAALLYVRDKLNEGLPEKLGEQWIKAQDLRVDEHVLARARVGETGKLELDGVLAGALDPFDEPRVSPDGRTVAYRGPAPGDEQTRPLLVVALEKPATPMLVADHTAMFYDWSADGQHLVYAATKAPLEEKSKDLRLGVVARRRVCGDDGAVLGTLPEPEELAGILFQREVRVRCLRDGRVLFATVELEVPCTSADMPQRAGLFAVDPGRQPGVTRVIPRPTVCVLPDAAFLFAVSPDERHVCIPGSNGRIVVLTLATGSFWEVAGEDKVNQLRMQPAWRNSDEVCFTVTPELEKPAQVVLAKLNWRARTAERRVISADWPEAVGKDFLAAKEAAPASQP